MKIFIMTDQEGVAGVLNSKDFGSPDARFARLGWTLLTAEVNAAIEGFFAGGATEILVTDGHGDGSIDPVQLDPRVELQHQIMRVYPYNLDRSFDFIAWVGQHAMSRTEYAHLAHTGSFAKFEYRLNGTPVGEFGQLAMAASELGVRALFASGDAAFAREAQALVPGIETVAVKRGTVPGRGDECTTEQYAVRNVHAIHWHPERARRAIREGAERAVRRARTESFGIIPLRPPFEMVRQFRPSATRPAWEIRGTHPDSVITLLNSLPIDPPAQAT